ncbi:hypothetical protein GCM10007989_16820 [Devosia pacifica]|uniref:Uncharacterized protein n=1 Tax=Devosia pacifica TaxID=1335967 RepID=A0A918VTL3_9HYPH|nr:hypothetical protein [Devosia pacifica]GHA22087.1 hypothetical protein GCM10007989_16820 [Devosia pacifica]
MRLIFRIVGTWLIGLALVVVVIDGTKSLASDAIVTTQMADMWMLVHAPSLEAVREFFATRLFAEFLGGLFATLLTWPAFVVIGVPGLVLAFLGRRKRPYRLVRQDDY